jgi:hypothetical protein
MADLTIANVGEKLVVGQIDPSFLTLASKFVPGTAVLNGPVYIGALTGSIGLDRATCTIGPPLPGLSIPASLEVDGITNIFGNLNVFGIDNIFAFSNVFGFTSRVGAKFATAFNADAGAKVQVATNLTYGYNINQAFLSAPLSKATAFVGKGDGIFFKKKPFDIPHPTKDGWRLRHVCIEGPTADVYVRGNLKDSNVIELPEYWRKLVHPETITVNLTPIGTYQELYVDKIEWGTRITIKTNSGSSINCNYTVYGERADTDKNIPEYEGTYDDYPGDNRQYTSSGTSAVVQ